MWIWVITKTPSQVMEEIDVNKWDGSHWSSCCKYHLQNMICSFYFHQSLSMSCNVNVIIWDVNALLSNEFHFDPPLQVMLGMWHALIGWWRNLQMLRVSLFSFFLIFFFISWMLKKVYNVCCMNRWRWGKPSFQLILIFWKMREKCPANKFLYEPYI